MFHSRINYLICLIEFYKLPNIQKRIATAGSLWITKSNNPRSLTKKRAFTSNKNETRGSIAKTSAPSIFKYLQWRGQRVGNFLSCVIKYPRKNAKLWEKRLYCVYDKYILYQSLYHKRFKTTKNVCKKEHFLSDYVLRCSNIA